MTSRSDRLVRWVAAMWQLEHVMFFLILVVIDIARAKWRRTPAFNLTLPYLNAEHHILENSSKQIIHICFKVVQLSAKVARLDTKHAVLK